MPRTTNRPTGTRRRRLREGWEVSAGSGAVRRGGPSAGAGSGVTIDDVPPARRTTFTDHKLRSKDDAENLVIALERGQIE